MQIAGMTKSPFPLLDSIMLGPLLACLNVILSVPIPEYYVLVAIAVSWGALNGIVSWGALNGKGSWGALME
jgi:hypothetical protein